jgi:hypothetical protein
MSKPGPGPGSHRDLSDAFADFLSGVARFLLFGGIAGVAIGLGFLIYTFMLFGGGDAPATAAQAASNIDIFQKVLLAGLAALAASTTYTMWGEQLLGFLQLLFAAALWFAPLYLPMALGGDQNETTGQALGAIQMGGTLFGIVAIGVIVADGAVRFRDRSAGGFKADQLKYGKGIKEEADRQNVFMGKCWQLPFCRKFVRERCPIYHSKRTCWKERVGCMCEEEVIRNAMENRPIPKDQVAAAAFIPINNKLTMDQKAERCRQCVIYNEHQKHKYRLLLPVTIAGFTAFYFLFREPLMQGTKGLINRIDSIVGAATFGKATGAQETMEGGFLPFQELLLVCFMVVAFAYAMKLLEYLVFKLKV